MNPAEQILKVFFGCRPADVGDDVICTPIPAFYHGLLDNADTAREYRGWWRLATVAAAGATYTVVHHFEGARVVDPVRALARPGSRMMFLGLAGAIAPDLGIGDLVRVGSAFRASGEVSEEAVSQETGSGVPDPPPVVRAFTADGLLDDIPASARADADIVDLETFFFFQSARARKASMASALTVITDRPGIEPFWSVSLSDAELARAVARMSDHISQWWRRSPQT